MFYGDTALYAGHEIVRFSLIVICFNRVKVLESWTLNCYYCIIVDLMCLFYPFIFAKTCH